MKRKPSPSQQRAADRYAESVTGMQALEPPEDGGNVPWEDKPDMWTYVCPRCDHIGKAPETHSVWQCYRCNAAVRKNQHQLELQLPTYNPNRCPVGYVEFEGRTFSSLIDEIQELRVKERDALRELLNLRQQLVLLGHNPKVIEAMGRKGLQERTDA